jgi:hypothetical protein
MRIVSPNSFGSYAGAAHRGLVTCHGDEAGKLETKSFTASGLTKITLPNGCSAETDTHIFAAADDGFDRAKDDYIVAYVWRFDPLTLLPERVLLNSGRPTVGIHGQVYNVTS